ncbi:MAG: hypothetical protein KKC68_06475, partial [Candidatus Thermoplasmatota archaeon]|nr:hypothetical protein [Candidatus Thermoplasmatota archaeon]MBU1941404.1 hypothetical protein [Candidatus Thermoplasmatota archaeon]
TTPVVFGVQVSEGSLVVPGRFMLYAFGIKIVHILMALCIVVLGYASFLVDGFPVPGFLFVVVSVVILYLTYRLLSARLAERDSMLIFAGLQEGLSFLLLPIVLMSYLFVQISVFTTVFLLVVMIVWPLFWFRLLFGRRLIPLE